jgi:ABC-type Na+ efflux pump permease subunit
MISKISDVPQLSEFEIIFGRIVSIVLGFAGIAFFVMLLVGGFKYLTAGGEPPAIESARKTLTFAIAGLVLIALSFLFLQFIKVFTGVNVTEFRIFQPPI